LGELAVPVAYGQSWFSRPRRKNVIVGVQEYSVVDRVVVEVIIKVSAVTVSVPLLIVSVSVVVVESVISRGDVMVVVSAAVVDSTTVLVTVPRERIEEQYTLPSSAWRSSVASAKFSHSDGNWAMATPAEASSRIEGYNIMIKN
jgi:hypothetical protein